MYLKKALLKDHQTIQITGSKSISNRLLILKELFGNILIGNLSNSQDSQLMQKALASDETTIDIHHAGTAMRFLTSFFAIQDADIITSLQDMRISFCRKLILLKTDSFENQVYRKSGE